MIRLRPSAARDGAGVTQADGFTLTAAQQLELPIIDLA